jgi:hypothetical protein
MSLTILEIKFVIYIYINKKYYVYYTDIVFYFVSLAI